MESIISQLPGRDKLTGLTKDFKPEMLGTNSFNSINADGLGGEIRDIPVPDSGAVSFTIPDGAPTKKEFMTSLNGPLDKIKNVNISSVVDNITDGSLPVDMGTPTFDINGVTKQITDKIIPAQMTVPSIDIQIPGLNVSQFSEHLNKLANAGAATPMKFLDILMNIAKSFVGVVTDQDLLIKLTKDAVSEIYSAQVENLKFNIPWIATPHASELLSTAKGNFLVHYQKVLNDLENLPDTNYSTIETVLTDAGGNLLPDLQEFEKIKNALLQLKENKTDALTDTLEQLNNILSSDAVFLQPAIDSIKVKAGQVLGPNGILKPVEQLKDMAENISGFLDQCGDKAEEAANTVSTNIETTVNKIEDYLTEAEQKIKEIETQIQAFLDKIDISPVINKVIDGCNQAGDGVDTIFTKVEEMKQKLDTAVIKVQEKVDTEMTSKLQEIEGKIRELLGQISGLFEKPEVKDALAQAKSGIDTFKAKIEEVSLKAVFDLVADQTQGLETSIKKIDAASLGTPQKVALKIGGKVIEAVKVDEIVKPELLEVFKQIQEPLLELITLLKEKVLIVEQMVYEFNPGTIANDQILNSQPYKVIIATLESFKPSELLKPLKKANAMLTDLIEKLNPDIIIDELQKLYNQVYELVESLNPESLNKIISGTLNTAGAQLGQLKGPGLDNIIETIKATISLEKLMEKTGIEEIAKADFWKNIKDILGGGFLTQINQALSEIKTKIEQQVGNIDFTAAIKLLTEIKNSLTLKQADNIAEYITTLANDLESKTVKIEELENKRSALLMTYKDTPELKKILVQMDLTPVIGLKTEVLALKDQKVLETGVAKFQTTLTDWEDRLKNITEISLQNIVPDIFDKQISIPVNGFISDLQELLKPYTEAVDAVQGILQTITTLPAKIDASVAKTLGTLKENIEKTITKILSIIDTFGQSLTDTINDIYARAKGIVEQFSPALLLNAFSETSFSEGGLSGIAGKIAAPSGQDKIGAALHSLLTSEQSEILSASGELTQGKKTIAVNILNKALKEKNISSNYDAVFGIVNQEISELKAKIEKEDVPINTMKSFYRYNALCLQLTNAKAENKTNSAETLARLNRVILEAAYSSYIDMSIQSLHPYIVEQISMLYPDKTVQRLDEIYTGIVEKIKQLPKQMIGDPLDDEFNKIKTILKENFDISGIFSVIEIKMDGLDEDLSAGLDQLSRVYNGLLTTFNRQLG